MSRPTSVTAGVVATLLLVTGSGAMCAPPAAGVGAAVHTVPHSASSPTPSATPSGQTSPSAMPSGQTPPSPIGGLAPYGLIIGVLLIAGVSLFYGRRNQ